MQIIVVGAGQLAAEILGAMRHGSDWHVTSWADKVSDPERAIVVHAGSGRELPDVLAYCRSAQSILVELATGSALDFDVHPFPVVMCPNTNILMLKFMAMLAQSGTLFEGYKLSLTESHQSQKTSAPGTALAMAKSLGLSAKDIVSVRSPEIQKTECGIPAEHLQRHAYHQIKIEDGACSVMFETRVYGAAPYVDGVVQIVRAIDAHVLENRRYDIREFVQKGWV